MTAPKAVTNGAPDRTSRRRLPLIPLRKPLTHLRRQILAYRRHLEAAVMQRYGRVSASAEGLILSACSALRQTALVERIMAKQPEPGGSLTPEAWLQYSDRSLTYRDKINKAIAALGLADATNIDPFASLYAPTAPGDPVAAARLANRPDAYPDVPDAAAGQCGDGNIVSDSVAPGGEG